MILLILAVQYGLNRDVIATRVLKWTYGDYLKL